MMSVNIVVGFGAALASACSVADAHGLSYLRIELASADGHNFDLAPLAAYAPGDTQVFVALDQRALNYARQQLIAQVRLKGYKPFDLVAPGVIIGSGVSLKGNVYIGPGSQLGNGCVLGTGCWLESGVLLGSDVHIGAGCSLGYGVRLGAATRIGAGTTLGDGVNSYAETEIGRQCEWLLPGLLPKRLPDRSFFDMSMPEGARILNH